MQAREPLNSEMPKTIHACPSINKSIERLPPLTYLISVLHSLHYYIYLYSKSLRYYPGWRAGLGMRRKRRSIFFRSERSHHKGNEDSENEIIRTMARKKKRATQFLATLRLNIEKINITLTSLPRCKVPNVH